MRRAVWFYALLFTGLTLALGGALAAFILLGDTWYQLIVAFAVGIILTQFAFIGHEASHRQVFHDGPANDRLGRAIATFISGLSYSWWMNKHTRHHGNPNTIGKDPDIETETLAFYEERAASRRGWLRSLVRHQGNLFFPLLLVEGINLHRASFFWLLTERKISGRATELTMMVVRFAVFFFVIFSWLSWEIGLAFVAVQFAVFGLYMGASFAPNHKGMPLIPRGAKVDFMSRQVLTSRNVSGGLPATAFMGGLNYQIEHHLFPSMARPYLARARVIVRENCETTGLEYTETSLWRSYGIVIRYLNRVGLAARDPFTCPAVRSYRVR